MSKKKIIIINGPNLNLVGKREPNIYGNMTFEQFFDDIREVYSDSIQLSQYQSNVEGELINKIQEVGFSYDGIILNAGGYTHTSVALRDAVAAVKTPVIEVHISNPHAREEFRHTSLISGVAKGIIAGFGLESYAFCRGTLLLQPTPARVLLIKSRHRFHNLIVGIVLQKVKRQIAKINKLIIPVFRQVY